MSGGLYVCLDQGGHGSRAVVFDGRGRARARAHRPVATRRPRPGWVEQDPEELLASLRAVLAETRRRLGARAGAVRAAALATQRSSIVCWDRHDGTPLSPVLSWQDRRAAGELRALAPRAGEIHRRTGLVLSPHYGASKLRWCLDHLPAVAAAARGGRLAAGPLASFLAHRLAAGAPPLADPANAARTLLWNLATGDWDPWLLECFRIPREVLPECVPSRHRFGELRDWPLPLALVTGDQPAALFAGGRPEAAVAYVTLGTGAFVQRVAARLPARADGLLRGLAYRDAGEAVYTLEGTVNGAASALDWAAGELGLDPADLPGRLAAALDRDDLSVVFLNAVSGLGAPFWRADLPSRFVGEGDPDQRLAAVAESIVFLLQTNLEVMEDHLGPARRLQAAGGLAAADGLCQRLADLARVPVLRPAEREATARGLAWLLAGKPRDWAAAGAARFAPRAAPGLAARYRRWRAALDQALAA